MQHGSAKLLVLKIDENASSGVWTKVCSASDVSFLLLLCTVDQVTNYIRCRGPYFGPANTWNFNM